MPRTDAQATTAAATADTNAAATAAATASRSPLPQPDGEAQVFTLRSPDGLQVAVMDHGATWLSCQVPLDGGLREVLLGHATPAQHQVQPGYLGAVVGRLANRIAQARFALDGRLVTLDANEGPHHLHGGTQGWHRRRWQVQARAADCLELALHSPAGEQGYPGAVDLRLRYQLQAPLQLTLDMQATATAATPLGPTSHAYFNLDGAGDIGAHRLQIPASRYLPVGPDLIPTGEFGAVAGTAFDFRRPRHIAQALAQLRAGAASPASHDHCWLIDAGAAPLDGAPPAVQPVAQLWSGDGRLALSLHSSYPGLQFYAGEFLPHSLGRDGRPHLPHAGLALEPQYLPDSPNHAGQPGWPDCVLRPGRVWRQRLVYRFQPHPDLSLAA
ncbi:aldose epimerase family protein [Aquabacterium sp. OR-4]|uniref:aldose epimerase family protein n=1 Tax=Aquabacterium sp. OR-4 TaxID=2978127 RepID=UPI0028C9F26C|nr:aldose epimerase family protein [Aquabacterium sp. OR-4]MDT7838007.1 aldose epimerase family protein [Aquabacterium sp. OR-4]